MNISACYLFCIPYISIVCQVGVTIAVNFWHDMTFGPSHVLLSFLRNLTILPPSVESALLREAKEALQRHYSSAIADVRPPYQKNALLDAEHDKGEASGEHANQLPTPLTEFTEASEAREGTPCWPPESAFFSS